MAKEWKQGDIIPLEEINKLQEKADKYDELIATAGSRNTDPGEDASGKEDGTPGEDASGKEGGTPGEGDPGEGGSDDDGKNGGGGDASPKGKKDK